MHAVYVNLYTPKHGRLDSVTAMLICGAWGGEFLWGDGLDIL